MWVGSLKAFYTDEAALSSVLSIVWYQYLRGTF